MKVLEEQVIPWLEKTYTNNNICYVWQQVTYQLHLCKVQLIIAINLRMALQHIPPMLPNNSLRIHWKISGQRIPGHRPAPVISVPEVDTCSNNQRSGFKSEIKIKKELEISLIFQLFFYLISDLNPLDYAFWSWVQDRACPVAHANVEALKASITASWNSMSEDFIKNACASFPRRLKEVIDAKGGSIKSSMKN